MACGLVAARLPAKACGLGEASVSAAIVAASTAPATPVTTCDAMSTVPDSVENATALAAITASAAITVMARLACERSTQAPANGVTATAARPPAVIV